MTRPRLAVGISLLAAASLAAGQPALGQVQPAVPGTGQSAPQQYLDQELSWKPCYPEGPPDGLPPVAGELECASFSAPRDWNRPGENTDVTIAVSRLPAERHATGSLLTNPGGPGSPGRTTPLVLGNRDRLRVHQEIIGIDPRGTGDSSNITCGRKTELDSGLDPRDRSRDNLELIQDANELIAQFCQTKSGELGRYINTAQTVRDYDLLRELLDREKINWVGYSGGTWLGAHYATRFPDRVGRFVLDSSVDFTASFQSSFARQPLGFERRFREDFLRWLAEYDSEYHLGSTADRARQTYERIRASLAEKPVKAGGERVTAPALDSAIVDALYSKDQFTELATYLVNLASLTGVRKAPTARAAAGTAVAEFHRQLDALGPRMRPPRSYQDAADASFITITCNDTRWTDTEQSLIRKSARWGKKYPLTGWAAVAQPCVSWDRPPVHLPRPTGHGVPPVLIVQSTHDPATPIEGARRAHRRFDGSRMITVTGEGDHGVYALTGNTCVDRKVERYLVDGVVPDGDSSCPGMPLPDPNADGNSGGNGKPGLGRIAHYQAASGAMPR